MMNKIFERVQFNRHKRNTFNMPHSRRFNCEMGKLIPCLVMEVLPGDTFNVQSVQLVRFQALVAPIMQKITVRQENFFTPWRLLWKGYEDWISATDPSVTPVKPYILFKEVKKGSLADFIGVPIGVYGTLSNALKVDALWFAAVALIFNEYYRDENLVNTINFVDLLDGDQTTLFEGCFDLGGGLSEFGGDCPFRAWEHDYFTSCLPTSQAGDPVQIPLLGEAPIFLRDAPAGNQILRDPVTNALEPNVGGLGSDPSSLLSQGNLGSQNYVLDLNDTHVADLSAATSANINDFRRAMRLQEYLEAMARGGFKRFKEYIKSIWGVTTSDARLQRPEFLGGNKSPMAISEVVQSSQTSAESPQGNQAGHGINFGSSKSFSRTFEEYGCILGFFSILPETAYMQGINAQLTKFDPLDVGNPYFGNLGEQPVKVKEVYAMASAANRENTFGYLPRFSEYKFMPSTIHNELTDQLAFWHDARKFASEPALNAEFITANPDDRIFAVTDDPQQAIVMVNHAVRATRMLPEYGVPTI